MRILPGLSFSWKRALGVTAAKLALSRVVGVPLSRGGVERKIGRTLLKAVFGRRRT